MHSAHDPDVAYGERPHPAAQRSGRMEIDFGAKVRSVDGKEIGSVGHIIVDSNTKSIAGFMLRGDRNNRGDTIVPIELAVHSDPDGTIHLSCPADEVTGFPDFEIDKFVVHEDAQKTQWNYLVPYG